MGGAVGVCVKELRGLEGGGVEGVEGVEGREGIEEKRKCQKLSSNSYHTSELSNEPRRLINHLNHLIISV
jgi:hypothetical protein